MKDKETIRLAKYIALAGICSRRKAEELIKAGKVKIANKVIKEVSTNVLASAKDITVDNRLIKAEAKVYYLLNKPLDYICSVKDPHNPQTVISLVPKQYKVFPVGRLDKNSTGLLLLTNDGDLAYKLTHPSFVVSKTYLVKVNKVIDKNLIPALRKGVKLEEGLAKADKVVLKSKNSLAIVIHQGWKRQIRRMLDSLDYKVISLTRIAEGKLKLDKLAVGKYKQLNKQDII